MKDIPFDKTTLLLDVCENLPVAQDESVKEKLHDEIAKGARDAHWRLLKEYPFVDDMVSLEKAEENLKSGVYDIRFIREDLSKYKKFAQKTDSMKPKEFALWRGEIDTHETCDKLMPIFHNPTLSHKNRRQKTKNEIVNDDKKILRKRLQRDWRKLIDEKSAEWELNAIAEYRLQLFKTLRQWLELLQKLADILHALSIEPGLLFDLSKGNLSLGDIEQIKRWAEYISQNEGVKNLCEMLGRLRMAEKSKHSEMAKIISYVDQYVPDINSREEIVGIRIGKDIEYALPQEKALLADEDTALLFDLKFVEGRLLCFEMEGMKSITEEVKEDALITVEEEEKLGPIIVCVDTSGSMSGAPETIAKAVTLVMATRAMSKKRNCYLINFSTDIKNLDLSEKMGIGEVIPFLRNSFHGGTDVAPALKHALEIMTTENYQRADLLVISDFVMDGLPGDLREKALTAKKGGNKFYSLCIGNLIASQNREVFDNEWVYNPATGDVHSLLDALPEIDGYH